MSLGADVLAGLVVVISPAARWIAFGVPGHLDVSSHSRAPATAGVAPQTASATIPFGPDYQVTAEINGETVALRLDYGSTGAVTLRDDVWRRVIPPEARTGRTTGSTRADGLVLDEQVGKATLVKLGSVTLRDVPVVGQAPSPRLAYQGLLGLAVLGATTTVLDTPRRRLWMFAPDQEISVKATPDGPAAAAGGRP